MPEHLGQMKLVDLKRSNVDEKKSDPKKGKYAFVSKVYFTKSDFADASLGLNEYYQWVLFEPNESYRTVQTHKYSWGFEFVTVGDRMWPEGIEPDSESKYVFKDVVLMKCPLINWLKKVERDQMKSDQQAKSSLASFEKDARDAGIGVSQETLSKLLGIS